MGYNSKSLEIGTRIRDERKKLRYDMRNGTIVISESGSRKVSQEILLEYIRQEKLTPIKRNKLSDLEQGKDSAVSSISIGQLETLCSIFGCSIGYLMGEYACHTHELQVVTDQTGLTEAAAAHLSALNDPRYGLIDTLSVLIEDPAFEALLELFYGRFCTKDGSYHDNSLSELSEDMLRGFSAKMEQSTLLTAMITNTISERIPDMAASFMSRFKTPDQRNDEYYDISHVRSNKKRPG